MRANISILVKNLTSGGAEKQSVLLAKALCKRYSVHYVIFNGACVHDKYIDMLKECPEIDIVALEGPMCSRFSQFVKLIKEEHIELIFSYLTGANAIACLAAKLTGARAVTGLRNSQLPRLKLIADRFLTNHMAACAVSNSYSGRDAFVAKGFKDDKVKVIPNCFEPTKTKEKAPDDTSTKRIITVGRFVAQKDYPTALRAIERLQKKRNDFKFVIVGYGELEDEIRQEITRTGLDECVEIHINPDNISELLANADIYLSTSLFEGTSNSIMEALDASLPVVCTAVGDNDHLVKQAVNGYLTPVGDDEAITDALEKLLKECDLRTSMGEQSRKRLIENFSTEVFTRRYCELITALGVTQEKV